jgi:uncharacterized protein
VATRPPIGLPKLSRRSRILLIIAATIIVLLIVGARLLDTYVNYLWYGEVGFKSVFNTMIITRIVLFFAMGILVGGTLSVSLIIAYRTRPVFVPLSGSEDPLAKYRSTIVQRVRLFGIGIPLIVGLIAGSTGQGDWQLVQLMMNGTSFGRTDPEFHKDIGFYAFTLPFITWLITWLFVSIAIAFFGALITHYLFGGIRLAGRGGQFSVPARVQLSITAGLFVVVYAVSYFFERYELLFSDRNDLFNGATYTDLNAVLPAKLILMFIAGFCAVAFFVGAFMRNLQLPAIATALLVLTSILIGAAWPAVLQQFSVKPNENVKEAEPIQHNLDATKYAFGLEKIDIKDYPGVSSATPAQIRADTGTVPNVRLLDPSILSSTYVQKEGRENYYGFPEKLDVDRYEVDGKVQDYIVAAREISTDRLAENQKGWINRHMQYTHGDGFVAAPANRIDRSVQDPDSVGGGYPVFTVSDLVAKADKTPMKIPVDQSRIYYGELATDYAIVGGKDAREIDRTGMPLFRYDGAGGVSLDSWFSRLVFAAHFTERNILFNSAIGEGSKIMYNRDPRQRVSKVAPWLTLDGDPYAAVINGRIQWIVDGYTTLEKFPYAQQVPLGSATSDSLNGVVRQDNKTIGYIRNSVKATVDAYDGTVSLYSINDDDPVLRAWEGVFPGTVKQSKDVPKELRQHFRYPEDLFKVQRELLARYHVSSPQDFFSTQTFWDVPKDPTKEGSADTAGAGANQPPYYVLAQVGDQKRPTFQVTSALTALRRQFLASWVSVSSDPEDYGTIRVLRLPTNANQTDGPNQVQTNFKNTDKVTEARTLFQNPNSQVIYGNLLTLPVAGGLLFVEPIYIQPKTDLPYPKLARVLVSFGKQVGFAPTLDEALDQIFGAGTGAAATKPEQGGGTSTSTPATSTTTPPPSGGGSEVDDAIKAIELAMTHVRTAQTSGSLTELGKAFEELDAAFKRYDAAKVKQGSQTSTPSSPSTTPSPTPGSGGG